MAALGVVALGLTGCDILEGANIASFVSVSTTCEDWTVAPFPGGPTGGTFGPYTDTEGPDGEPIDPIDLEFHAEATDGVGTLLFDTDPVAVFSLPTEPQVYPFDPAPAVNPIAAGFYDQRGEAFGVEFSYCPGLPFQARALLAPGIPALASTLPTFDVIVSAPVTGIDVADLELGGTAEPTGATITARSIYLSGYDSFTGFSQGERNLILNGTDLVTDGNLLIYRVAITGITRDGTVTLRLPAGVLASTLPGVADSNVATSTVTATVDRTGPTLESPSDVTRQLVPGETSAPVTWTAPVASDASGVAAQSCAPASGSDFSPGDTIVTCTATDTLGNLSSTAFAVHVLAAQTPTVQFAPDASGDPDQGETVGYTVTATDHTGATSPLAASDYTVTSSVPTDIIVTADGGFSVSYPHASPHILTVTQTSTGASAQLTVQVTPTAVAAIPAADGDDALSATGADLGAPIQAAAALLVVGAGLLAMRGFRRRAETR